MNGLVAAIMYVELGELVVTTATDLKSRVLCGVDFEVYHREQGVQVIRTSGGACLP